jgi:hypothetical protein
LSTPLDLLDALASFRPPNVFNPWRDIDPLDVSPIGATPGRLRRAMVHFNCEFDYLQIGEAPG